jgi:hypothetical protein
MRQNDVSKFVGEDSSQAGFIREHVNEAAAEDDGVPEGE